MVKFVRPTRYTILRINELKFYEAHPSRGEPNQDWVIWILGPPAFELGFKPTIAEITFPVTPEIRTEVRRPTTLTFTPLAILPLSWMLHSTESITCEKYKYLTHCT
jgi:hypothetical protein